MSKELKNSIHELRNEITHFNINDVLVHADGANPKLFFAKEMNNVPLEELPNSLIRETRKTIKESGVNPLCISKGIVELELKSQKVRTPVLLTPLNYTVNKIKSTISFDFDEEDTFVNPFLILHLELNPASPENINDLLTNLGLTFLADQQIIGNFHHHRFEIVKELDELTEEENYNDGICSLLGYKDPSKVEDTSLSLPSDFLFPSDSDHRNVFQQFENSNLVIQGPPGTGKSQLLSNILGKLLSSEKNTIVVSEKRVALEVLKKRLSEFNLDKYCFIATSDHLSHDFLQELKNNWDFLETTELNPVHNLNRSEQLLDNLQMTLDFISQPTLIGGVSFHKFKELCDEFELKENDVEYISQTIDIDVLEKKAHIIDNIFQNGIAPVVGKLRYSAINDDQFRDLDVRIEDWIGRIDTLNSIFEFNTWSDFIELMKVAGICQIFENALYKKHASLFVPGSRAQKSFFNLRKKLAAHDAKHSAATNTGSHWKKVPSKHEIVSLTEQFNNNPGWFKKRALKKRWYELANVPIKDATRILESELFNIEQSEKRSNILVKLIELGVNDPEREIEPLYHTIVSISEDEWAKLNAMPEDIRLQITNSHVELNDLYTQIKRALSLKANENLLEQLEFVRSHLSKIIANRSAIASLPQEAFGIFNRCNSFKEYGQLVLNAHRCVFKDRFPAYSNFNYTTLKERINEIIRTQQNDSVTYAKYVEFEIKRRFDLYHETLSTPARKLSEEQKQLKVTLRKGKSILVKEFSKSRSHPSLRELYNSEARLWIQLLKPIWLSNPTQLAKCFPMEMNLFDVAIFDEASQIPLQNALGTIQRSKKIIVAGDEHQMGPSSFFKAGSGELLDLLHQANYYWNRVPLKHHYRSVHPDLIAFSNKHFYHGELKSFPSYEIKTPIQHHYIEKGKFIDRCNTAEAIVVGKFISTIIKSEETIGVVAFSEEQLNAIWSAMDETTQEHMSTRISENTAFFKALENVQGDECDRLIISFGYGFNEKNEFNLRFGPMNTVSGRNRLNVLLTRAIQTIDFFCSVRSTDFKLTDNESILLLKKWIQFSENYTPGATPVLPFELDYKYDKNKIIFKHIQKHLSKAVELVTLQHVMESRGWELDYT